MKTKDQLVTQAFELIRMRGYNGVPTEKLRALVAEGERVKKEHPRTQELIDAFAREIKRRETN